MQKFITSHNYYIGLLASLLAVFIISPFFGDGELVSELINFSLLFTLLFCVLVISHSKKLMIFAALLAAPLVIGSLQSIFGEAGNTSLLVSGLFGAGFVLLIIVVMLRDMFVSKEVDTSLIIGSISLYFLLGLLWGFIYMAIEHSYPGSFRYAQDAILHSEVATLMYYSMVTLTTLGYGDIVPISAPARAMANLEAITGQIYLTVLVARLVGMHIAQKK